jgi:Protein of unknown function (DUF1353)
MKLPTVVSKQRLRFYDGGDPGDLTGAGAQPPDPTKDVQVLLERRLVVEDGRQRETFVLCRRIAYDDRHCGEIIVPARYEQFDTDLTSVPAMFTWLVPKTGAHLPAALIHDGLVWNPATQKKSYVSTAGKEIDRVEADRIFRDGMADTGTGLIRRWLVWTAVTLATMWSREATSPNSVVRNYYRWLVPVSLLSIGWLGYVATADLFDRTDRWWMTYELAWMGDHSFIVELMSGAAGAIVIPAAIGLLWGKFYRAGWIAGIGIGVLLHVTVAIAAVSALYVALEFVAARVSTKLLQLIIVAFAITVVIVFRAWLPLTARTGLSRLARHLVGNGLRHL